MLDYTLPVASLLRGRRISQRIDDDCLEWDITDLWLPFFSVSTNITTSKPVIHQRGNGAKAIRASCSIPGVLPPVSRGEDLLVDGGVLNNMPMDVMRNMNPYGAVIAIDVSAPKGPSSQSELRHELSGWQLLLSRLHPGKQAPKVPAISGLIMQSRVAGSSMARESMLESQLADHYQNIHVRGVGMLQFESVSKSVETGYRESIEPLRQWADRTLYWK